MVPTAEAPLQTDPEPIVRRLIGAVGIADLMRMIADMTQEEADRLLMAGDRVNAAARMREFRIVERAAGLLQH